MMQPHMSMTALEREITILICMSRAKVRLPPGDSEINRGVARTREIIAKVLAGTTASDLAEALCNRVHGGHVQGAFAFIRTPSGGRMSTHAGDLSGLQALAKEAFHAG